MNALNFNFIENNYSQLSTDTDLVMYNVEDFINKHNYNENIDKFTNPVNEVTSLSETYIAYIYNFYNTYSELKHVGQFYKTILFRWKGDTVNIMEIYLNIGSTVLSSYLSYDFFSLNLKFVNAAIFYELRNQEILFMNHNKMDCDLIKMIFDHFCQLTSQQIDCYLRDMIVYYSIKLYNEACGPMIEAIQENKISSDIENIYKMFGIFFDFDVEINYLLNDKKYILAITRFNDLKILFSLIDNYFNSLIN